MDKLTFDKQITALRRNAQTFKKYLMLMILSNVILVLALMFNINRERVVLVPQVAPEYKMWVSKSQVSPEYLNTISRNTLDLLLNITPTSVSAQHQELMRLVAPKYHAELELKFTEISKQIIQNNLSQNFFIENIRVLNGGNVVYVRGVLNQYIDKNTSSTSPQIYKITFEVHNYLVGIGNIELIKDNDPQLKDSPND